MTSLRTANFLKASILADAATMPLHWIYNQADITAKVGASSGIFFETPSCPFYSYPSGVLSPYGAEAVPFFRSVAETGAFDFNHAAEAYYNAMKTYPDAAANGYAGRLNHVPKVFIENRDNEGKAWADCHVDDSQAQGISKVALIVARYAGHPDLVQQVTRMVDVLQISPISIESSVLLAKLFERILFKHESPSTAISSLLEDADRVQLTAWQRHVLAFITSDALIGDFVSFAQALNNIPAAADDAWRSMRINGKVLQHYFSLAHPDATLSEALDRAKAELSASDRDVVAQAVDARVSAETLSDKLDQILLVTRSLGLSCALPSALLTSLYILRESSSLTEAVERNIRVGGDNCSRAMVVAAAFAAYDDNVDDVLAGWESKVQESWWKPVSEYVSKVSRVPRLPCGCLVSSP